MRTHTGGTRINIADADGVRTGKSKNSVFIHRLRARRAIDWRIIHRIHRHRERHRIGVGQHTTSARVTQVTGHNLQAIQAIEVQIALVFKARQRGINV